jgi:hypothetical protein
MKLVPARSRRDAKRKQIVTCRHKIGKVIIARPRWRRDGVFLSPSGLAVLLVIELG